MIRTHFEVHYWHQTEQVESFEDACRARSRFEELYKAAGYYNLKLVRLVTTVEVLDKGYERNVSMMNALGGDGA